MAHTPAPRPPRRTARALAVAASAAVVVPLLSTPSVAAPQPVRSNQLQRAVTLEGVMRHLDRFEQIADNNGGNRAAGTPGYDRSATYVQNQLERAGYRVRLQPFSFESFVVLEEPVVTVGTRTLVEGTDYNLADYSGSGDAVTGALEAVDVVEPPGAVPTATPRAASPPTSRTSRPARSRWSSAAPARSARRPRTPPPPAPSP